jgi:hypothetical protein
MGDEGTAYKTRLIGESWRLREEEVPRYGTRLQRVPKAAVGTDGTVRFWVARRKDFGFKHPNAGLKHDFIEE